MLTNRLPKNPPLKTTETLLTLDGTRLQGMPRPLKTLRTCRAKLVLPPKRHPRRQSVEKRPFEVMLATTPLGPKFPLGMTTALGPLGVRAPPMPTGTRFRTVGTKVLLRKIEKLVQESLCTLWQATAWTGLGLLIMPGPVEKTVLMLAKPLHSCVRKFWVRTVLATLELFCENAVTRLEGATLKNFGKIS